jgi:hypothetical protein
MEAVRYFETLLNAYQTTRLHIPGDNSENLKSRKFLNLQM